ncbi:peptidoglycan recognition protein family protein [Desulfosporosinus fructosivorans]
MSTPYNRRITAIVLHHMGDGLPPEVPIQRRWNPARYDYPEYDYGIEADGTVRVGRSLNYIGSHTQSDKEPYRSRGTNWWNKHAIGIGLAGDFTKYPMPRAQFNALVALVKQLMTEHQLSLNEVYPHGQVTYTSCPGCTYSKVPALKGLWSYDEFERAVLSNVQIQDAKGNDETVKDLVVYADGDTGAALLLSYKLQCPMVLKDFASNVQAENKHWVGVKGTNGNGNFYYAGSDRIATAKLGL